MYRTYIPNQHGAWAMLAVPFLMGGFAARFVPLHALLFIVWLLAYLFAYVMLQWIRTGKGKRYRNPAFVYGASLLLSGSALLVLHPASARMAPLFLPLLLVNAYYAKRKRERALANDIAAIVQFCLIAFVSYEIGGGHDWGQASELFVFCVLYFAGTALYVKTMIRERKNPAYYRISAVYHLLFLAVASSRYSPLFLIPITVLFVRALWSPRTTLTIKQSGMLEVAYSVLIVISAWMAYT